MNTKECKSVLEMQDLYFSKYNFENNKRKSNNIETDINVNYEITSDTTEENNEVSKTIFEVTITSKDESVYLYLQAVGMFKLKNAEELDEVRRKYILERNTIAIMFPYIRSQVSLMTTQPGLQPILLQPLNINKLIEEKK